jgi:hypothetical protein
MRRRSAYFLLAIFPIALIGARSTGAREQQVFVQRDISAARIVETSSGCVVDLTLLAADMEEMFQSSMDERRGIDLSAPGVLEEEIGKFVARRVSVRGRDGNACRQRIDRSGEDPKNDEGVLVSLVFECSGRAATYDAGKFIDAHSRRASQIINISQGNSHRQMTLNAEHPTAVLSD